ncbi:hypothetical protein PTSG_07794 [Salpingoeca rosetta]|uniref:Uncharacterized protein n=1 Tax=Salpingoeca rosetta (strain ATCC 50818 / BSB-021) TaxID=946362 RepID=F2UGC5_SALR5|nr:uncharacterized protein PTSG_07794 [Salpingoeca rosetta]EGD75675.1 hypothetical protein PTSG_07794 [Salpingoeca rosetta]|eukprot:XP_004991596.1 hypothetical protein PTSG_07794 [Salpingoeca rosetta]
MGALADATTAAVAAAAEEPLHYELRRSLPWWYRALAGVTVPSVHSAIGYTVKQCKDRLAQQVEADAERVAAVSALVDKLAKGVTMPKVFDLLNLCRPRTPAVPIASVSQCDAVSGKLRAKGIAFLDDLLGDVMEDHELLKTVLPNALKRNSVFVDYTAKLHAKGLEIDPASFSAVALHPTTSVAFTATPWSFQVNKSSITITAGAEAASQPQRVEFRHTPQLEQLLKRVQGLQDGDGASFQLHELATAVSPRDDFEVACLVRVLARLNVLEPAAANKQHAADGDHGEASVPEQYEHLITDTPAPPPVTDTQQQQQQEEKKKEEEEEEEGDEVEIVTDDDGRADENSEPKKD